MQAMPEADDNITADLEKQVNHLISLGEAFTEDRKPETLVSDVFQKYSPKFLANRRIEFMCHCNKERLRSYLTLLPIEELKDIRNNGPFPLEIRCHHCNTTYHFEESEIKEIYGNRFPDN